MYELEGLCSNYYLNFKRFFTPNTSVQLFTVFTNGNDGSSTISNKAICSLSKRIERSLFNRR